MSFMPRPAGAEKMHLYLAGPMSGYPDSNYPAFFDKAAALRKAGFFVKSPAETPYDQTDTRTPHSTWMRVALKSLIGCQAIYMLKGWEASKGAQLELEVALACGMAVFYENLEEPS